MEETTNQETGTIHRHKVKESKPKVSKEVSLELPL